MAQTNTRAGSWRSSLWAEVSDPPVPIETSTAKDALWICQTDLLRCFDSETRGTWRLVCKRACKAVEDNTRCLKWKDQEASAEDVATLSECSSLRSLDLGGCERVKDMTALLARRNLHLRKPSTPREEEMEMVFNAIRLRQAQQAQLHAK
eukprot:gene28851-biopygen32751